MVDREAETAYADIVSAACDLCVPVGTILDFLRERDVGQFGRAWDTFGDDARARLLHIMDETPQRLLWKVLVCRGRALARITEELEDLVHDVINDLRAYQTMEHKLDQLQRVFAKCRAHGVSTRTGLQMVEHRLGVLWRESARDPPFRQHLLDVRAVFERFVARYRFDYRFNALPRILGRNEPR